MLLSVCTVRPVFVEQSANNSSVTRSVLVESYMKRLLRTLPVVALILTCDVVHGQAPITKLPTIDQLMTPEQFAASGLQKLTPAERQALNAWLQTYTRTVAQLVSSNQTPVAPVATQASGSAIESRIDGEFNGWDGETIFKLQNGQIWQQSSYAYMYHYAFAPKLVIFRSGPLYKMQVEGVSGSIYVRRLK
jgi:hypothetical protein